MDPITRLMAELSREGYGVPAQALRAALDRADIRLTQGGRPMAEALLGAHAGLSGMIEKAREAGRL